MVSSPGRSVERSTADNAPGRTAAGQWYVRSHGDNSCSTSRTSSTVRSSTPPTDRPSRSLNPATGEVIAHAPLSTAADVDRAVKAARRRVRGLVDDDPRRARARPAQAGRRDRGARRRARRARVRQRRQADQRVPRRRDPVHGRQPAVLRGRRALPGGPRGRRVHERLHVDHPPRAGRRDRPDRALELPADDGRVEDRARRWRPATRSCSSRPRRPR